MAHRKPADELQASRATGTDHMHVISLSQIQRRMCKSESSGSSNTVSATTTVESEEHWNTARQGLGPGKKITLNLEQKY